MKIEHLSISNILSFAENDFQDSQSTLKLSQDLNIIIGPNGSGKSNLVEIIFQLYMTTWLKKYSINHTTTEFNKNLSSTITGYNEQRNISYSLAKHFDHQNAPSRISITFALNDSDKRVFKNIIANKDEIVAFGIKYGGSNPLLSEIKNIANFEEIFNKSITLSYEFVPGNAQPNQIFRLDNPHLLSASQKFLNTYLTEYHFLKSLIEVANMYENKNWIEIGMPITLISSMRQYAGFNNHAQTNPQYIFNPMGRNQQIQIQSTKTPNQSDQFSLQLLNRIGLTFRRSLNKKGIDYAIRKTNTAPFVRKVAENLKEFLGFELKIEGYDVYGENIKVNLYKNQKIIDFNQMSIGEQSIFYLVFLAFCYDTSGGMLIVDEPENHLHTNLQSQYFGLLKKISARNTQALVITHSPVFIDADTIENVHRASKPQGKTVFHNADLSRLQRKRETLKYLTYTNSSEIFFSDLIILVEGETDAYFLRHFFDSEIKPKEQKITVSFLQIGGKGELQKWREFLSSFNIPSCFIGDFDNILDFGIEAVMKAAFPHKFTPQINTSSKNNRIANNIKQSGSLDGNKIFRLLDKIIKEKMPLSEEEQKDAENLWKFLQQKATNAQKFIEIAAVDSEFQARLYAEIDTLRKNGLYILKHGCLENYLGTYKGLHHVVEFCNTHYSTWKKQNQKYYLEIKEIFSNLLKCHAFKSIS